MKLFQDEVVTVSQFNTLIKEVLSSLGIFRVKGEITELTVTKNKGVHITLSDGKSNLRVGGYAPSVKGIDLVEKGMEVVVEGTADIYVPYGSFSLSAFAIEPVGEGSLAIAYQKLKEKLETEGLFAEEHKQELPRFITTAALLTGKDSAAYSDFVKILQENKVGIEILYYPVLVQGSKSVKNITETLLAISKLEVDVIVLTRGGGSLEDLKGFNNEELARLIFTSSTPVIVGVGHEKDESICDFVADKKASTPSQAAYYIVEQNKNFLDEICEDGNRIADLLLDAINQKKQIVNNMVSALESTVNLFISNIKNDLSNLERILESFDIKNTLKRGFAIIKKEKKRVSSIKSIRTDDKVDIILTDGSFNATVNNIEK